MSFNAKENSIDDGSVVFLYDFQYGDAEEDSYRFASTAQDVVAAGRDWKAWPIKHDDITLSGSLDRATLNIQADLGISLTDLFIQAPPSRPVTLDLFRGHWSSDGPMFDEFKRVWTGRVLSMQLIDDSTTAEFSCEPSSTSIKRVGLRRFYQYGCPHVLYGTGCKVPIGSNTAQAVILGVTNPRLLSVTISSTPYAIDPAQLVGGMLDIEISPGRRGLRAIAGASWQVDGSILIYLLSPIPQMAIGMPVKVIRGCPHTFAGCRDIFGNTRNYGGCPNIPTVNPFVTNAY